MFFQVLKAPLFFLFFLMFFPFYRALAEPLNGYIAPMASAYFHLTSKDNVGPRFGARVEFARIQKWIAMNFRYTVGQGYEDGGGAIRFYNYWETESGETWTLGAGPGLVTARKGDSQRKNQSFNDYFVETALTFLTPFGEESALIFQVGFDSVIQRAFPGDDKDGLMRIRPFFNFGIAFGA